jgi:hypothetical protein
MSNPETASGPSSPLSDLQRLQFLHELRDYHHSALWEIQKHFTWLLSIVLAAQAAILTTAVVQPPERRNLLIGMALLGLAFSLLALRVVRKEGEYFFNVNRQFVRYHNRVFPEDLLSPPQGANLPFSKLLLGALTPWRLGVRDSFQLVSIVFTATFAWRLFEAIR